MRLIAGLETVIAPSRAAWLLALVGTLSLTGCSEQTPTAPAMAVVGIDGSILRSPSGALASVWVTDDGQVFSVGEHGYIIRYDKARWHTESSGTLVDLAAVDGRSPTDVYAAGAGLLLHFDGSMWTKLSGAPESEPIAAIADPDGGVSIVTGRTDPIHYFDGHTWTFYSSPDPHIDIVDAVGSSSSDLTLLCWRAWGSGYLAGSTSCVYDFDGRAWNQRWSEPIPDFPAVGVYLRGIWTSAEREVFALGSYTALHFDGLVWTLTSLSPTWDFYGDLDVWGSSGRDVYSVGSHGLARHFDGSAWTSMYTGTDKNLLAVSGSSFSGDVYAVGEDGIVLNCQNGSWAEVALDDVAITELNDVQGTSAGTFWAAGADGSGGLVLQYDNGRWQTYRDQATGSLSGIWASPDGSVFAVGDGGRIIHYVGGSWVPMSGPTHGALLDVAGVTGTLVYAVGRDGVILVYDGQGWSQLVGIEGQDTMGILSGVWCSESGDVVVAGTSRGGGPLVLFFDGVSWTRRDPPMYGILTSVWGSSPNDVYVAGAADDIYHYDGKSWSGRVTGAYAQSGSKWRLTGTGRDDVWLIANSDQMYHFDGGRWARYYTRNLDRTHVNISAAWSSGDGHIICVGAGGLVLDYTMDWQP